MAAAKPSYDLNHIRKFNILQMINAYGRALLMASAYPGTEKWILDDQIPLIVAENVYAGPLQCQFEGLKEIINELGVFEEYINLKVTARSSAKTGEEVSVDDSGATLFIKNKNKTYRLNKNYLLVPTKVPEIIEIQELMPAPAHATAPAPKGGGGVKPRGRKR